MKISLIKNSEKPNKDIFLVFLGYSFLPECLNFLESNLNACKCDICVVYDYSNLDIDKEKLLSILKDKNIYLLAWSMGVWAFNLLLNKGEFTNLNFCKKVAINGTPFGINDEFGIPKNVFKKSIDEFDFDEFKKICFLKDLKKVEFKFNQNPKFELEQIYTFCKEEKKYENSFWDKVIISKKDFIFPPKACEWFLCKKERINAPHFPFFYIKDIGTIFEI